MPDAISRLAPDGTVVPPYRLRAEFVLNYADRTPDWGPLGEITYARTYRRELGGGEFERWIDTCVRVTEGTFYLLKLHYIQNGLDWKEYEWEYQAERMLDAMFNFRFTPPGRGLWAHGTEALFIKGGGILSNCGYRSTIDLDESFSAPFTDAMGYSMFGTGIGIDAEGAGKVDLVVPRTSPEPFVVEDSREGWMKAYGMLLESFAGTRPLQYVIDASHVRKAGEPLLTFGGRSGGPAPLLWLLQTAAEILLPPDLDRHIFTDLGGPVKRTYAGGETQPQRLTIVIESRHGEGTGKVTGDQIRDLFAAQGACVVSGGMRRSAILMKGRLDDPSFMSYKDPETIPDGMARADHPIGQYRWAANNSVDLPDDCTSDDVGLVVDRCAAGEDLGILYMERHRAYGRTCNAPNYKDAAAVGVNACGEITLENCGLCIVDEVVVSRNMTLSEFLGSVESAFLYAKIITLTKLSHPRSDLVNQRTRRIGVSVTGVIQALKRLGGPVLEHWLRQGYATLELLDGYYSERWGVPESIKLTTVKPSGTVSLLMGATPGGHAPKARYWVKRMRFSATSPLLEPLRAAGYLVEPAISEPATFVVEFPGQERDFLVSRKEQSVTEQFEVLDMLQRVWADQAVSFTVDFDPDTERQEVIDNIMRLKLKGFTLFPREPDLSAYSQIPFSELSGAEYGAMVAAVTKIDLTGAKHEEDDSGCTTDTCILKYEMEKVTGVLQ